MKIYPHGIDNIGINITEHKCPLILQHHARILYEHCIFCQKLNPCFFKIAMCVKCIQQYFPLFEIKKNFPNCKLESDGDDDANYVEHVDVPYTYEDEEYYNKMIIYFNPIA